MNKRIGRYEEFLQLLWNEPGFEEMFDEWKGLPDNKGKDLPYRHTEQLVNGFLKLWHEDLSWDHGNKIKEGSMKMPDDYDD